MKAIKTYALLAALFAATLLPSCKKSDQAKESAKLLTTGPWNTGGTEWQTTAGAWVPDPGIAVADYPAVLTFFDNGTYTAGATSGSAGTWQLSADRTQLVMINSRGSSLTVNIAALTSSSLQLAHPLPSGTYTYNTTTRVTTYYTSSRTSFTH